MTDYLSSDVVPSEPRPRRQRAVVPIAAAAALVMVAAGGALAYQALDGGGEQPERWAPPSTFAFAKLDLDPPAGQKVAAYRFSRHFPDAPKASDADELRDAAVAAVLEDAETLDYERDVKPWLGKRIAVAAFPGAGDEPAVVGIIQHTDAGKAEAALKRAAAEDDLGFTVLESYVVVGDDQTDVDAAVGQTRDVGLDSVDRFADDVDALDGDSIVTGWVDVEGASAFLAEAAGDATGLGELGSLTDSAGRLAFAVRAAPDHVEVEGRGFGMPEQGEGDAAGAMLADLPKDTMAALSFAGLGGTFGDQFEQAVSGFPGGEDQLAAIEDETGLKLPEDLETVLGDRVAVAGRWEDGAPEVGARTHPEDRAAARDVVDKVLALFEGHELDVVDAGDDELVIGYGQGYAERLAGDEGGDLGDLDLVDEALVDLDSASAALYVDLQAVLEAFFGVAEHDDPEAENLRPLKAVGMTAHSDGDEQSFRLRLVAKG